MAGSELKNLDQGVFCFPRPGPLHTLGYVLSAILFIVAAGLYSTSLSIPDVPRVDEAIVHASLETDPSSYEFVDVQGGYDEDEYASQAAFVIVPLELERGVVGYDSCTWTQDDDGGGHWDYSLDMVASRGLIWTDSNGMSIPAHFSLMDSLSPEGEVHHPECNREWYRTIEGYGPNQEENRLFNVFMLVEQDPERYQLLSIVEVSDLHWAAEMPQEVTQREDKGRWALLLSGLGGFLFMVSTTPPLLHEVRTFRKAKRKSVKDITSAPGVLGSNGRILPHFGPNFTPLPYAEHPARAIDDDWLLGAPAPTAFDDPYKQDADGRLMPEHPNVLGTPSAAVITPYSIGAIVFAGSFIWLSADLRARDGSEFHVNLGWFFTIFVTFVNLLWFRSAWKQFKLTRLVLDLPTSPIRSVAVGQAELVGQVRPSIAGTPEVSVAGRTTKGLVAWEWKSYEYVCTTVDGKTQCSWKHRETKNGGVPFMIHDGSGGMLIDPSLWAKETPDYGPTLDSWTKGKWKWELAALGVGDPVYILGDCVPRDVEHINTWGGDETLPQALLTMVPTTNTGDPSVVHYGTEVDILAKNRSMFEILLVPLFFFIFGVFMFVSYTP